MKAIVAAFAFAIFVPSQGLTAPLKKAAVRPASAKVAPLKPSVLYDFKSAKLGMTLAEMKALPLPVERTPSLYESKYLRYGPQGFICSTDQYANGKQPSGLFGRLYEISITGSKALLADVLDGLNAKFGAPDRVTEDTTQNKAGATFPHSEHVWANPAATVTVEAPWTKIDNLNVLFISAEGARRLSLKEQELHPSTSKM